MHTFFRKTYKLIRKILQLFILVQLAFSPLQLPFLFSYTGTAYAAFNPQINYQGKLTTSSSVAVTDGSYNLEFKLYNVPTGGSPLWTETWCKGASCSGAGTDNRVQIASGLFSVLLGSTTAFTGVDFNQTLYLGVNIGGSNAIPVWDGEMTPRKKLGAVPAALVADTIDNLDSTQFLRADAANSTSTASAYLSLSQAGAGDILNLNGVGSARVLTAQSNGFVGIGTTTPFNALSVVGSGFFTGNLTGANLTATGTLNVAGATVLSSTLTATGGLSTLSNLLLTGSSTLQNFTGVNATTTTFFATTASSTNLFATSATVGSLSASSLSLSSALTVGSGGTGASTFGQGWLYSTGGTANLTSSTSPTVNYLTATSTTATSTFSTGGLTIGNTQFVVQQSSGNVGIGTAAPTNALQVTRSSDITTGTFSGLFNGSNTFTNTTVLANSNNNGYVFGNTYNLTNPPGTRTITGAMFNANLGSSATTSTTLSLVGLTSQMLNAGSNALGVNLATTTGFLTSVGNSNANASNSFTYSFRSVPFFSGTGTNVFGFYAQDFGGAGTVTNQYGLYIDPLVKATNNFGVFVAGTTTNYFGGKVGISSTSPSTKLTVGGDAYIDGNIRVSNLTATGTLAVANLSTLTGGLLSLASSTLQDFTGVNATTTTFFATTASSTNLFAASASIGSLSVSSLSLSSALTVGSGGTGASTFGQGWLYSTGGTVVLSASTSPTVSYITATSTTATSTFSTAGFTIGTNRFVVQQSSGNVGIGTTSPYAKLSVNGDGHFDGNIRLTNLTATGTLVVSGLSTLSGGFLSLASSTLQDFTGVNATTTTFAVTSIASALLKTAANGALIAAVPGTDYIAGNSTLGVANGGTGASTFGQGWLYSTGGTANLTSSTSPTINYLTATSTTATSTFSTAGFTIGSNRFVVQQGTGNIGIGTTTPGQLLTVAGHATVGSNTSTSDSISAGLNTLYINELTTNVVDSIYNVQSQLEVNPSSASSRFYYGGYFNANTSSGSTNNITGRLAGVQGQVDHNGTGTIAEARGTAGTVANFGSGTITNAFAGRFGVTNNGTGNVTNAYGMYLFNGVNTGSIANKYGLYIENQSNASTLNYALYAAGGQSYFGGNVGIGTTTPGYNLSVSGDIIGNSFTGSYFIATSTTENSTIAAGLDVTGQINTSAVSATTLYANEIRSSTGTGLIMDLEAPWIIYDDTQSDSIRYENRSLSGDGVNTTLNWFTRTLYGNWGVGTSTPFGRFSISANSTDTYNPNLFIIASSTGGTSTSTLLTVLAGGNVGIGTTSPYAKLSVNGDGHFDGNIRVSNLTATGTLAVSGLGTLTGGFLSLASSTLQNFTGVNATTTTFFATTASSTNLFAASASIGSLSVSSLSLSSALTVGSGGTGASTFGQGWLYSTGGTANLTSSTSPTINYLTATSTTATSTFSTGGLTVGSTQFVVQQSSGNVGIGTAAPTSPLHIINTADISAANKSGVTITETFNGAGISGNNSAGLNLAVTLQPSAAAGARTVYGALISNQYSNSAVGGFGSGTIIGALSQALSINTTQVVGNTIGFRANVGSAVVGGSVTNAYGFDSAMLATGTTTNAYHFHVTDPTTVGTLSNQYGFYVDSLTHASTSYAVFTAGNTQSSFGGNVGIGTTSPFAKLSVVGQIVTSNISATSTTASSTFAAGGFTIGGSQFIVQQNSGRVGIGTTSPGAMLHLGSAAAGGNMRIANGWLCIDTDDTCTGATTAGTVYAVNAYTVGADLAENYKTSDTTLLPGEIVTLDTSLAGYVKRAGPSDPVFGVISTKPGVLLGRQIDGSKPVALTGRVPLLVNAEGGPIHVGDKIALSSVPGIGKKANGNESLVGIALGSFEGTTGEVEVFMDKHADAGALAFKNGNVEVAHDLEVKGGFKATIGNIGALIVDAQGNVGIGTDSPAYKLQVLGDIAATSFVNISTRTSKKDITYLDMQAKKEILAKIKNLQIAEYHYTTESADNPLRLGLIAEEAPSEVLSVGGKGVDVYKLTTFALAGIQEQQKQIDDIETRVASLEAAIASSTIATSTPLSTISYFESLGINITQGIASFVHIVTDSLTIGSSAKPSGITLYDEVTGNPYCLKISGGVTKTIDGECSATGTSSMTYTMTPTPSPLHPSSSDTATTSQSEVTFTFSTTTPQQPPPVSVPDVVPPTSTTSIDMKEPEKQQEVSSESPPPIPEASVSPESTPQEQHVEQ